MSIYQAKHKARGRYGVLSPKGQWLEGFLGDKLQAIAKADELNQQTQKVSRSKVVKATKPVVSNKTHNVQFILTKAGWLKTGE